MRNLWLLLALHWLTPVPWGSAGLVTHRSWRRETPEACEEDCQRSRRDVVDNLRQYAWRLVLQSRENLSMAGKDLVWKRNTSLDQWSVDRVVAFERAAQKQRGQALAQERAWLAQQTAHNGTLRAAAEYQLLLAAFSAMKGDVAQDKEQDLWQELSRNATRLREVYDGLLLDLRSALDESTSAQRAGERLWRSTSSALDKDMSWLQDTVHIVDLMANAVPQPYQDANWTRHAVRLASDLAEVGDERARKVEAQVQQAEGQARRAQLATQTNSDRLDKLEDMVTEVEGQAAAVAR